MKKVLSFITVAIMAISLLSSCKDNAVRNIPSGFVGKKLTPSGWDKKIYEAGQVDIGTENNSGNSTSLVLLEVTTTTVMEKFVKTLKGTTGVDVDEDHRVRTKDGTPLDVDIYVQIAIPVDPDVRNSIFAMITPKPTSDDRVSQITVQDIYERFAKMTIRGNTRGIFAQYKDADDVMLNYTKINAEISQMIISVTKEAKTPFEIVSAQLSNIKEDPIVLESKNKMIAAKNEAFAIDIIGKAIRDNPYYLESKKLDVERDIGARSNSNLVIMDNARGGTVSLAIPANK